MIEVTSRAPAETADLGETIGRAAVAGDVVALWGELGAGKTVLARGIARGLGLDPGEVTSPTFVIVREHLGGRLAFFHVDLYRLSRADLPSTGWEEAIDGGGLAVIEWPDRAGPALPPDRLDVKIAHAGENERRIELAATGRQSERLIRQLAPRAPAGVRTGQNERGSGFAGLSAGAGAPASEASISHEHLRGRPGGPPRTRSVRGGKTPTQQEEDG